jgi:hypothetical protein
MQLTRPNNKPSSSCPYDYQAFSPEQEKRKKKR